MMSKNRAHRVKRGEGTLTTALKMEKNIIHTAGMTEILSMIISKDSKRNWERQLMSRGKGRHKDSTRKMTFLTTGNRHSISKTGMPAEWVRRKRGQRMSTTGRVGISGNSKTSPETL
jgi:hypothetical protein